MSKPIPPIVQRLARKFDLASHRVQDIYPCTSLQASLFAASLHGLANYVATFVFNLSAITSTVRDVRSACELLYRKTPLLRTHFIESGGTFLQVVTDSSLEWNESSSLDTYLEKIQYHQVRFGDPLARFAWIDGHDGQTYMVWSLHHAVYDEWSIALLFEDLSIFSFSTQPPECIRKRPRFSKFVKALSLVDQEVSATLWKNSLAGLSRYQPIHLKRGDAFETAHHASFSCHIDWTQTSRQLSTVILAAWSIFVAKLSGSADSVVFGNIVNGRTAPVPGIVDMCGPTMATVPCVIDISWNDAVQDFLDDIERIRRKTLPFEQMGLNEYRRHTGAGTFDTLLSVRLGEMLDTEADHRERLLPSTTIGHQVRHPCCIYLDVSSAMQCLTFNASFDNRYIDGSQMSEALNWLSQATKKLTVEPNSTLRSSIAQLHFPRLLVDHSYTHGDDLTTRLDQSVDPEILEQVQKIARSIRGTHSMVSLGSETTLRELGLDSLTTVVLARRLCETFAISLPFTEMTGLRKTIREITNSVQKLVEGSREDEIAKLDLLELAEKYVKDLQPKRSSPQPQPLAHSSVLLTGASGYIGIEILRHLLVTSEHTVVLLVRCKSPDHGLDRVCQTAKMAAWDLDEISLLHSRVQVWPSDLAAPNLGLDARRIDELSRIGTIIHNGARVDFSLDYHDLEATNVSATAFLLSRHLQSVSAPTFVYLTGGRSCALDLNKPLAKTASELATANGYAQTKFTCELLLHRASEICKVNHRKATMVIVHPGIVIGGERTGVANTDDFIWRYVAASIQMRAYVPAVPTKREWVNLMTADSVAFQCVSASTEVQVDDKVGCRVMRSGLPVTRFWATVLQSSRCGDLLEPVSEWEWVQRFKDDLDQRGVEQPLFSLSQLILQGVLKGIGGVGLRPEQEPPSEEVRACERAVAANVRYLEQVGFFSRDGGEASDIRVFSRSKR